MTRADKYRLKKQIDKELRKNTRWTLYSLVWNYRKTEPISWEAIAHLIRILTEVTVSSETLRRWFTGENGKFISEELLWQEATEVMN